MRDDSLDCPGFFSRFETINGGILNCLSGLWQWTAVLWCIYEAFCNGFGPTMNISENDGLGLLLVPLISGLCCSTKFYFVFHVFKQLHNASIRDHPVIWAEFLSIFRRHSALTSTSSRAQGGYVNCKQVPCEAVLAYVWTNML